MSIPEAKAAQLRSSADRFATVITKRKLESKMEEKTFPSFCLITVTQITPTKHTPEVLNYRQVKQQTWIFSSEVHAILFKIVLICIFL